MIFKRKIYDKLLQWKEKSAGEKAILIEGARRIGKSTIAEEFGKNEYKSYLLIDFNDISQIVIDAFEKYLNDLDTFYTVKHRIGNGYVIHLKNLSKKDNILYIPSYMTFCL